MYPKLEGVRIGGESEGAMSSQAALSSPGVGFRDRQKASHSQDIGAYSEHIIKVVMLIETRLLS